MDSLTQIVLGAAVGEAVLGKKVGNRALLWGAAAGTIPDLDVYCGFIFDDLTKNEMHRGLSHSLLFHLSVAPLFSWLVMKKEKLFLMAFLAAVLGIFALGIGTLKTWAIVSGLFLLFGFFVNRMTPTENTAERKDWTRFMFLVLFTHALLDAHTSWGTQLLWPLPWKFSWNNIFVADPLYTIPLMLSMIIILFINRKSKWRSTINYIGMGVSSLYMVFTLFMKWVTFRHFRDSLVRQDIPFIDISTRPTPLNCILWTANVKVEGGHYLAYYSIFDTSEIKFVRIDDNEELLEEWKDSDEVERLWHLTEGEFCITEKDGGLVYNDLRFGMFGEPREGGEFVFAYRLIPDGDRLIVKEIEPPRPQGEEFNKVFNELIVRAKGI